MKKTFLILLFFFQTIFAQTFIRNETLQNNIYSIKFHSELKYALIKEENRKFFVVGNYKELSSPGDVALPSRALIISLPIEEKPEIEFNIISEDVINAIPKINLKAELSFDNKIVYSQPKKIFNTKRRHFEVKGYFWIDNLFCVNIQFNPATFDSYNRRINLVKEFEIKCKFKSQLSAINKLQSARGKAQITINKGFVIHKTLSVKFPIKNSDDWIDYSKKYVKIGVAKDGVYRIKRQSLENLNIDVTMINPSTFQLMMKGEEIPIFVKGEEDGSFDDDDFIEFVGIRNMGGHHREVSLQNEPYNEYLGRYTDTTIYWLTWNALNPLRIPIISGVGNSTDTLKYYSQIEHYERNNWFDFSCPNTAKREMPFWCSNKTWHEGNLGVGRRNRTFSCSDIFPNKTAKGFIKLQDFASDVSTETHKITLGINGGNWSDTVSFNKYQKVVISTNINSDLLFEGNNNLNIISLPTVSNPNTCIFDWYELEYPRYLKTMDDSLLFSFPFIENNVIKKIELQNIQTDNYIMWRFGDKYKKFSVNKIGDKIFFDDTLTSKSKFVFIDESKITEPKIYYVKQFKNLRNSENRAEYIAITHNRFINQVNEYADFIASTYNVETAVINIEDIYDEYSYGFFNPEAIKSFLMSTHDYWQTPSPQFVVLIGGATYDYYGYKHKNFGADKVVNYVPSFGAPVSDNWFVIWDTTGANILQMSVGRIPVTSEAEFTWYFEKLQNYVNQPFDEWNKRYIFFSGGNFTRPSEIAMFRSANQDVIDNDIKPAPIGGNVVHFYKTTNPVTNFGPYTQEQVQNRIDSGGVFIGYLGHSGTQTWDNSITQASQLENIVNRYPVITDFGCSTGRFAEPDVVSFSENFIIKPEGQAINYLGNSSLGFTSTATEFPKYFYKKVFIDSILTIGLAHRLAKAELIEHSGISDVNNLFVYTNELLGDPIVHVRIPPLPNFVVRKRDINFLTTNINDSLDSLRIHIVYYNWGRVVSDSMFILITDNFQNEVNVNIRKKVKVPTFSDSIQISIPINDKAGEHILNIVLDNRNLIDEIYENDNEATIDYTVYSSKVKLMFDYPNENSTDSIIAMVNPVIKPNIEKFLLQFSTEPDFSNASEEVIPFGNLYTTANIPLEYLNKRIWLRAKIYGEDNFGKNVSLFFDGKGKYLANDTISFSGYDLNKTELGSDGIRLKINSTVFDVISAGFNDGNSAVIMKNNQNFIPENTLRGHHVCIFKNLTYDFIEYRHFDLLGGGNDEANRYIQFLDTLSSDYLVLFAISDEGEAHLTNELKSKIKEFGSIYIDSLVFRGSWAFIGKRGASPGSMPEAFSKPFEGRVAIDTTISKLYRKGDLFSSLIGPASSWNELGVVDSTFGDSQIKFRVLGKRSETEFDTLDYLSLENGSADLSFLNDSNYSYIKIATDFSASSELTSPALYSLAVDYAGLAELGLNYQTVSIEKDTLRQGESANLNFKIYNVGDVEADSFAVKVNLVKPDNSETEIYNVHVDRLLPDSNRIFNVSLNTANYQGNGRFKIYVDYTNSVFEYFEDNNYFSVPFVVNADTNKPTLNITFDGKDILDGEYISTHPHIKILLEDESLLPITDTSAITIFLNNSEIYFSNNNELNISFSEENPKVTVDFNPELKSGNYTLVVFAKNALGTLSDSSGTVKSFVVSEEAKLLNVYNYPNPFSDETFFTFKLTRIPDKMTIDVYTVTGRLIREIKIPTSELTYDFNKIYWDGRDQDGDILANGVYFYKIKMELSGKEITQIQKLAVMR